MPALLPQNTGYTYAVDLSIDEAEENRAVTVKFDKPVIDYVDNFIGFPVGGIVPVGDYDRSKGKWIASKNGRVVKIISIENEEAQVDTTGDRNPDNNDISLEERKKLAKIYSAGKELWRVELNHFSLKDYNWPYSCSNCESPNVKEENKPKPCQGSGSIINIQTQTLGEILSLAGTGLTLEYNSGRVFGFKGFNKIELTPEKMEENNSFLKGEMDISIGG